MVATDALLNQLLTDLEAWKENLPEQLRFTGPESSRAAGMIWSLYVHVLAQIHRS